ncbi:MAG TPA: polysaccharide deacetylase family protein [Methanoregulaceae archaeon]|nr:polysaccharide deacetylase family protein [Methanoregulaceae archaeon]
MPLPPLPVPAGAPATAGDLRPGPAAPGAPGTFVVSLDCELYWGVRDKRTLDAYRENLVGDRLVVPRLLALFDEFGIHATWAFVGFLFYRDRESLLAGLPALRPGYADARFSPYPELAAVGETEEEDPFHYAGSLVEAVLGHDGQEVASHTFSHYYCLEPGQTVEEFRADLDAANRAAAQYGIELSSLVFPRNQTNDDYLAACRECGIRAYRRNTQSWLYREKNERGETTFRRAVRYADAFVNLSGYRVHDIGGLRGPLPVNVPASRFFYPSKRVTAPFDRLRVRRIRREMTCAAEHGLLYHLWWHPHNFGREPETNLALLREVLEHYRHLHETAGMQSRTMREVAEAVVVGR